MQVVIFVKDQSRAKMLNTVLNECNFPSDCIYGGMDQQKRLDVYSKFRNNQVRMLAPAGAPSGGRG
jgi:ATP-dependent RNA helicase UAP56/SUB2